MCTRCRAGLCRRSMHHRLPLPLPSMLGVAVPTVMRGAHSLEAVTRWHLLVPGLMVTWLHALPVAVSALHSALLSAM